MPQPVGEVVVDLGDVQRLLARAVGDVDDVQRREGRGEARDTRRPARSGTPAPVSSSQDRLVPLQVGAAQQLGQLGPDLRDAARAKKLDGLGDLQRLRPVVEQPAGAALDEPARVQPDPGLHVGGDHVVERLDLVPDLAEAEDRAGRGVRPHDLLEGRAGLLPQPVQEGRTAGVDRVVDQHRGDDLAAQRVAVDLLGGTARAAPRGSRRAAAAAGTGRPAAPVWISSSATVILV